MSKVSILLPVRSETYPMVDGMTILQRTVKDIYDKATGDFEVIVAFDGKPTQMLPDYPNLKVLNLDWGGTKVAVNAAALVADGKYLFKSDAHCMYDYGFDEKLQEGMEETCVITPRFYVLDAEHWSWQDGRFYDYFRLPCPFTYKRGFMFQAGGHWSERTADRTDVRPLDENMKLHGSAWFMSREHYWDRLGGLDPENGAGSWNGEDIEITMKTWLGPWGGRLLVNKDTWYAHMHRGGQRPREWHVSTRDAYRSAAWTAEYWMANRWEERAHDVDWLIEKFWPIPGWVEDWRDRLAEWRKSYV